MVNGFSSKDNKPSKVGIGERYWVLYNCIVRTGSVGAGGLHHADPLPAAHLPQPGGQPPLPRARAGVPPTDGGCTNQTYSGRGLFVLKLIEGTKKN